MPRKMVPIHVFDDVLGTYVRHDLSPREVFVLLWYKLPPDKQSDEKLHKLLCGSDTTQYRIAKKLRDRGLL